MRFVIFWAGSLGLIGGCATSASAQEATTYKYDALGRLAVACQVGGPSNGKATVYTYDNAGNRKQVTVNNPSACPNLASQQTPSTASGFVVTPLNPYTIVFLSTQ